MASRNIFRLHKVEYKFTFHADTTHLKNPWESNPFKALTLRSCSSQAIISSTTIAGHGDGAARDPKANDSALKFIELGSSAKSQIRKPQKSRVHNRRFLSTVTPWPFWLKLGYNLDSPLLYLRICFY